MILPLTQAPPIEPGYTYAKQAGDNRMIREVVYRGPTSAAVFLDQRFEVDEVQYHFTEPTKKHPQGKGEWRVVARSGAPRPREMSGRVEKQARK